MPLLASHYASFVAREKKAFDEINVVGIPVDGCEIFCHVRESLSFLVREFHIWSAWNDVDCCGHQKAQSSLAPRDRVEERTILFRFICFCRREENFLMYFLGTILSFRQFFEAMLLFFLKHKKRKNSDWFQLNSLGFYKFLNWFSTIKMKIFSFFSKFHFPRLGFSKNKKCQCYIVKNKSWTLSENQLVSSMPGKPLKFFFQFTAW